MSPGELGLDRTKIRFLYNAVPELYELRKTMRLYDDLSESWVTIQPDLDPTSKTGIKGITIDDYRRWKLTTSIRRLFGRGPPSLAQPIRLTYKEYPNALTEACLLLYRLLDTPLSEEAEPSPAPARKGGVLCGSTADSLTEKLYCDGDRAACRRGSLQGLPTLPLGSQVHPRDRPSSPTLAVHLHRHRGRRSLLPTDEVGPPTTGI